MHFKRIISGVTGAVLLIVILVMGGKSGFTFFVGLANIIAFHEYQRIIRTKTQIKTGNLIILTGHGTGLAMLAAANYDAAFIPGILALNLILSSLIAVIQSKRDTDILEVLIYQILGVFYIPFFLSFAVLIRGMPDGVLKIIWLLLIVFTGDIAAYYAGSKYGKMKLWPSVSPKKTIVGSFGGLSANLFFGFLFPVIFFPSLSIFKCVAAAIIVGGLGQLGDLFESLLKRSAEIKDSGNILPGHGGLLDRIDAVLFALPFSYYCFLYYLN